jgi:hypothetical protein
MVQGVIQGVVRRGFEAAFAPRRSAAIASADTTVRPALSSADTCAAGGSITTTVTDADQSQSYTSGDTITVAFNQCRESANELLTGALVFSIGSVSQTSGSVQFTGTMAFQAVTAANGTSTGTVNGSVGVSMVATSSTFQMSLTVGGDSLTVGSAAPGYTDSIVYDPGMQLVVASNLQAMSSSVTLNGSFSTASIGGRVVVSTVSPVVTLNGDAHPSSGQVVITGAAGTRLRVTALDNSQAQLDLDANGDGAYETSAVITWLNLGSS